MFKVGVRYCGGCNPRYDRGHLVTYIKDKLQYADFQNAREGVSYDALLIVSGCTSMCVSYEKFYAKKGIVSINSDEDIDMAVNSLKMLMEG